MNSKLPNFRVVLILLFQIFIILLNTHTIKNTITETTISNTEYYSKPMNTKTLHPKRLLSENYITDITEEQLNSLIQDNKQDFFFIIYNENINETKNSQSLNYLEENKEKDILFSNINNVVKLFTDSNVDTKPFYSLNLFLFSDFENYFVQYFNSKDIGNESTLFFFDKYKFIKYGFSLLHDRVSLSGLTDWIINKYNYNEVQVLNNHFKKMYEDDNKGIIDKFDFGDRNNTNNKDNNNVDVGDQVESSVEHSRCEDDSLKIVEESVDLLAEKIEKLSNRANNLKEKFQKHVNNNKLNNINNLSYINPMYLIFFLFSWLIIIAVVIVIKRMKNKKSYKLNKSSLI